MKGKVRSCFNAMEKNPSISTDGSSCDSDKKENYLLRSICAFAALALVIIHCDIPNNASIVVLGVGRFAIPIFLMLSGYYCYSRDGHAEKSLPRKAMHILKLAIFAKVLYTLLDFAYYCNGLMTWDEFVHSTILWSTTNMHLWFLYALFLVYVFWLVLRHYHVDFVKVYFLAPIILFLDILFAEILPMIGVAEIGGISTFHIGEYMYPFIAIPFFIIGNAVHRYQDEIKTKRWAKPTTLGLIVIGGFILTFFEAITVSGSNLYVGALAAAVCLFIFSYQVPGDCLRCRWLEYIGRNLAGWIYIIHPAIIVNLVIFCGPWLNEDWAFPIKMVSAIILSILASMMLQLITRKFVHKKSMKPAENA
jgi:surface polysaccharide O-acyltransferase-like enzyme